MQQVALPLILVADDSKSVRTVVRHALEQSGLDVAEVEDGERAVMTLEAGERRPDVVLLDIEMPGLGGLGVLARMRQNPDLCTIPVIMLTHHTDSDEIVGGLEQGAHDYLTKPFRPAELVARVRAALRTSTLLGELARRNSELDEFASKAAHDLKSPLTVIKGGADVLRSAWDRIPEADRVEQLAAISRAAQRAAAMVDDLLALARMDIPALLAGGAVTDARPCVETVVEEAGLDDTEQVTIEGSFGRVAAPEAELSAAIRNLLDNARHYGRSGDGTLLATIRGQVTGAAQVIEVADRGPGIAAADQARVFDAFYRGPGARLVNPASTGVGLAIVRRAIERWGGRVVVQSAAGEGTVFRVSLPLAPRGT
jgi:two-component system, sensor histidine kinase and response regulator